MAKEISDSKAAGRSPGSGCGSNSGCSSNSGCGSNSNCGSRPGSCNGRSPALQADPGLALNRTPSANRVHIAFFGKRNAGKSSLVNAVTGQPLSIVSHVKGTTTDPVQKAMELLPLGPVVIIDTPGIDDDGAVGNLRVEKTYEILRKTDAAVLVIDAAAGPDEEDRRLIRLLQERKIPFLVVLNKADLLSAEPGSSSLFANPEKLQKKQTAGSTDTAAAENQDSPAAQSISMGTASFTPVSVSALTGEGITELKEALARIAAPREPAKMLIGDKLQPSDMVVLVTPIDSSAPKGRLILPQVQTIRDILDRHALCLVTQTDQLPDALAALSKPPKLVITDSQDFEPVKNMVPPETMLTSFSILMARFKGILDTAARGAHFLKNLTDGDTVLISEGCTHHRQCEDIGTVKLPGWIQQYTGKNLDFHFTSGGRFPENPKELQQYALIVHCGGCMLNQREMESRMEAAQRAGVAFTNYGTLIAHINGILDRSLEIFYE